MDLFKEWLRVFDKDVHLILYGLNLGILDS